MKVLVIGGSNIDYMGKCVKAFIPSDSNIGHVEISFGGVGRNIVENLARLGADVTFITAIGRDALGKLLKQDLQNLNVQVITPKTELNSSSYLAIMNNDGDMQAALCDNEIINLIDVDFLKDYKLLIESFEYVVLETNLTKDTINYLLNNYPNQKFICDAISTSKALKLEENLDKIFVLKVNEYEYQALNFKTYPKNLIVTSGAKALKYCHDTSCDTFPIKRLDSVVNATGAGDALISGITYALVNHYSFENAILLGIKASNVTLMDEKACSKNIHDILK